jgi:hypothetical protein
MLRGNTGVTTSLLLHAVAAFGLGRVVWHVADPEPAVGPAVVWLGEWRPDAATGDQGGRDEADSERSAPAPETIEAVVSPAPQSAEPERLATDESAPPTAPPTEAEQPAAPRVDWADAKRRAIEDLVAESERAASYRSFAFAGTIGEQQESFAAERQRQIAAAGVDPEARPVLDQRAHRRAGLDEENPLGEYIVWVNDDCYQTHGTKNAFILPSALGLYHTPTTNCVKAEPRDDLFADQKPAHLMSDEELAQRTERWRRTETGAVATFDGY